MNRRLLLTGCAAATLAALAACSSTESTAPAARAPQPATALADFGGDWHDGLPVPGSSGNASTNAGSGAHNNPVQCNVTAAYDVTKVIGPSGGMLQVGPHELIIPPGALTTDIPVRGVAPAGDAITIQFFPEGLHFKKPAGLILDASSCATVPDVLYISEIAGENELIEALYSNWWHLVAAPLDHFSQYMLAM